MALVVLDEGNVFIGPLLTPPPGPGGGSGDVIGPGASAHGAIARFHDATGKLIRSSNIAIDDFGNLYWLADTGTMVANNLTTVQRDALTAVPGYEIWNTDLEKFQIYVNATVGWKSLADARDGVVIVNSLADFPAPIANLITLDTGVSYRLTTTIALGANQIVWNRASSLEGITPEVSQLTAAYAGAMIITTGGTVGSTSLIRIGLHNSVGSVIALNGNATPSFDFKAVGCTFTKSGGVGVLATLSNFRQLISSDCTLDSVADGLLFEGANNDRVEVNRCRVDVAGTVFDFGASISQTISVIDNQVAMAPGVLFLTGLANGGNVSSIARVARNTLIGAGGTDATNISRLDPQWQFSDNDSEGGTEISDTHPQVTAVSPANVTETVIASAGVAVKVNAAFTEIADSACLCESDATGTITYTGLEKIKLNLTGRMILGPVSGTRNQQLELAVNGVVVPNSAAFIRSGVGGEPVVLVWRLLAQPGDTFELFVQNETNTANLIATQITFMVT